MKGGNGATNGSVVTLNSGRELPLFLLWTGYPRINRLERAEGQGIRGADIVRENQRLIVFWRVIPAPREHSLVPYSEILQINLLY